MQNVYASLGEAPPSELAKPISQGNRQRLHSLPTGILKVKVDGRRTYFEWINAGHYACGGSRGTMSMTQEGLLADLYFGFGTDRLVIRLDARGGPFRERLGEVEKLRVIFFQPRGFELSVAAGRAQRELSVELCHDGVPVAESGVEAASDLIFELGIPCRSLAVTTDDPVHFFVELVRERPTDRAGAARRRDRSSPFPRPTTS